MTSTRARTHRRREIRELDARVGRELRALRIRHRLTQQEIADALGVSFQQVQKYEQGRTRVSVAAMAVWIKTLDLCPGRFLESVAGCSP